MKLRLEQVASALAVSIVLLAVPMRAVAAPAGQDPSNQPSVQGGDADNPPETSRPCHWWQFRRCDHVDAPDIEGMPDGAPRQGTVITVDLSTNTLYLFRDGRQLVKTPVATGSGRLLEHGDDYWLFQTPQGHLHVLGKVVDPVWRKPDWAFIEEGKRVPPADSPSRNMKGHLGKYALKLGDGIMIHGTDDPGSIGRRVSHGCIRLPARALKTVYDAAKVGTDVFIFQSRAPQEASSDRPEHHSDLDYRRANR